MLAALAWLVVALRYPVLAGWVVAAALAVVYLPPLAEDAVVDFESLVAEDSPAVQAERRAAELFDVPLPARSLVVQRDPNGLAPAVQEAAADRALTASTEGGGELEGLLLALPLANVGELVPGSGEQDTTVVTYLFFSRDASPAQQAEVARAYAASIPPAEMPVGVTGAAPARWDQWRAISDRLVFVHVGTLGFVALVFAIAFRSPGAPLVVLAAGGLAYLISLRLVAWVGDAVGASPPRELEPLALALLLGLVTDYAAFYMSGTRRLLGEGRHRVDAARAAALRYTPIVLTAGLIVALGTATMMLARLDFFRTFAPGLALTVLVTLAVGATFIPAALAVFGRLVFWPARLTGADPSEAEPPRWRVGLARIGTVRPVALAVVAVMGIGLVAAALPLRDLALGFGLVDAHPPGAEVRRAAAAAGEGFAPGIVSPTVLLLEAEGVARQEDELAELTRRIAERPGVAAVVGPGDVPLELPAGVFASEDGAAARLIVVLEHDPHGSEAIETLSSLREDMPALLEEAGSGAANAGYIGDTAIALETVEALTHDFRRVGIAAVAVNVLLLALFLRALVAPLYLVAASALSLAASLGITTYVFQELLGYADLTYYVPFAVAVLSLSLGSDYNLFVTGRIWQEAVRRPLRDAIVYAVPRSARAIAIAGITLAGSFAVLAVIPLRSFREFAFAMAVGVLLDTFVVRPLVVPALISLAGRFGFWPRTPPVGAR